MYSVSEYLAEFYAMCDRDKATLADKNLDRSSEYWGFRTSQRGIEYANFIQKHTQEWQDCHKQSGRRVI
jgi:hypothetical protein